MMNDSASQQELFAAADSVLPGGGLGGYSLPKDLRFIYASGEGEKFWDAAGREWIDYACGAGALILGHAPPAVTDAAAAQMRRGMHMFGSLNDVAVRLAERLVSDIPCAEKIAYATTGSEATLYAMRIARAHTGREKILKFEGAYHGNHDYALVSTAPSPPGGYPVGRGDSGGMPSGARDAMIVAPYNDLAAVEKIAESFAPELAGIIVEPIQRIIPARAEFLHGLRKLCDRLGAVLIFDEVVTGFRVAYGGAHAALGITPDLATFGKIIGGGGPLSVVVGKAELVSLADPRKRGDADYAYFNGTLHGNPVAAAATLAMLDELQATGFYDSLGGITRDFCAEAEKIFARHKVPAIVCNTGSLWQFLFMAKPPQNYVELAAGDMAATRRLDMEMLRCGNYMLPGVRRFMSAVHKPESLQKTLADLDNACREWR